MRLFLAFITLLIPFSSYADSYKLWPDAQYHSLNDVGVAKFGMKFESEQIADDLHMHISVPQKLAGYKFVSASASIYAKDIEITNFDVPQTFSIDSDMSVSDLDVYYLKVNTQVVTQTIFHIMYGRTTYELIVNTNDP